MTNDLILHGLAERINQKHELAQHKANEAVAHALEVGNPLTEAKANCPHGEWADWVKDNWRFSIRMAQHYMKIAREVPALNETKTKRVSHLSLRETISLLEEPVRRQVQRTSLRMQLLQ